jgi:dienelactone hydrolase
MPAFYTGGSWPQLVPLLYRGDSCAVRRMSYDPFARGPHPAGVRSLHGVDDARAQRQLPVEVWYPAAEAHRGQDLDPARQDRYDVLPGFPPVEQEAVRDAAPRAGRYPLVAFSHGFGGHRRQSTFLCTHLASHGYVVASVDHTGNTVTDMMQMILTAQSGTAIEPLAALSEFIALRPPDLAFAIEVTTGAPEIGPLVDTSHIGISGHSFGGWTTLAYSGRDARVRAALPLAPAGAPLNLPEDPFAGSIDFDWRHEVATLYIVADRDTLLPLDGIRQLYTRTREPRRMVVLENADHMHFGDRVEEIHEMFRMMPPPGEFRRLAQSVPPISELSPGAHAHLAVRGLGLAHFDAHLRGSEAAARLLGGDLVALLADRGVRVSTV